MQPPIRMLGDAGYNSDKPPYLLEPMSNEQASQSQSISIGGNAQVTGAVSFQAGRDSSISTGDINVGQEGGEPALTPADIVALIVQIEGLLQGSSLPEDQKAKAVQHLSTVKDEVQAAEPDKDFAAKSLQRATRVFKDASETVTAGQGLWQTVKPILSKLGPWLGVAISFFA